MLRSSNFKLLSNQSRFSGKALLRSVHGSDTDKRSTPFSYLESKLAPDLKELKQEIRKNRLSRRQLVKKHSKIIKEISILRGHDYYLRYFSFFKLEDVDPKKYSMKMKNYVITGALLYLPYKLSFFLLGFISQSEALWDILMTESGLALLFSVSMYFAIKYR